MKAFNFTEIQQFHFSEAARQVAKELLGIKFQDPLQDQQAIRRHAYLTGKLELLEELLVDEYPEQAPQNQSADPNPPVFG